MKLLYEQVLRSLRKWLPFLPAIEHPNEPTTGVIRPAAFAALTHQRLLELPVALRDAFSLDPLAAGDDRFVGRAEALKQMDAAVADWRAGHASLTAVIAPQGVGLTSFFNQVRGGPTHADPVLSLSLATRPLSVAQALSIFSSAFRLDKTPDSVEEAIRLINQQPRAVVMIDDGHMLLARLMGSEAAIQALLAVLVATQRQHCWVVGCAKQAWRCLELLHGLERYFKHKILLDYFSESELVDALDRRIGRCGLEWAPRVKRNADEPDPLPDLLKPIHQRSEGHIESALFLLLTSLQVDEKNCLLLSDLPMLDIGEIAECDTDEQFSLAEIHLHGVLSDEEHQEIFRLTPARSIMRLEHLRRSGLLSLVRTPEVEAGHRYRLTPLLARAIAAHLLNSNRLH